MLRLLPPPPAIETLRSERESFQLACAAPRTIADYAFDLKHFSAWCERMARSPLPSSPDTLSLYVTDLLTQGRKTSTVARYAAGVAYAHRAAGLESPLTQPVKDTLWGARRIRAEQIHQMRPLTTRQVRKIARVLAAEKTPYAQRNRAIVLVGFASALRRSNLAALRLEDVEFCAEGLRIRIRHEKQDRRGVGRTLAIPFGQHKASCPVRALRAWLKVRGQQRGALFTRLDNGRRPGDVRPLAGNTIAVIVKQAIAGIGLDARLYGPHSLRAGLICEAGQKGVPHLVIAAHVGHTSLASLQRYFRPSDAFKVNACSALGL